MWGTRKGQHACLFIETLHRHISQQWHTIASSDTVGESRRFSFPDNCTQYTNETIGKAGKRQGKEGSTHARKHARTHASKEGDPSVASSAFFLIFSHVPSKLHAYYVYDARAPNALAQEIGRRV